MRGKKKILCEFIWVTKESGHDACLLFQLLQTELDTPICAIYDLRPHTYLVHLTLMT